MDKAQFKEEFLAVINTFFQEERGNRITSNNIEGFIGKVLKVIDEHEPEEGEK